MIYVFDTNSLSNILNHYYPDRFPSFWTKFDYAVQEGQLISVRECKSELTNKFNEEEIRRLLQSDTNFFATPNVEELAFITRIYSVPHFQQNLERKKLLEGGFFADPFIIAKAGITGGVVVTEEKFKDNACKIPNICKHFQVECVNLEGFLSKEDWSF